jgi:hypothetical protein
MQNHQISHKELVHSDYQIREVEAVVRRDAFTTIHVHVPPYETNILRNLFGRENVTVCLLYTSDAADDEVGV